jgi:type II secretory pathway pseudopilin PulG
MNFTKRHNNITGLKYANGFTLLSVLAGILVFSFGTLALASGYMKISANMVDNEDFTQSGILAESLQSGLMASPSLITTMTNFNSVSYQSSTENMLTDWIAELETNLPGGTATAIAKDINGNNCTVIPCVVTVTLNWKKKRSHTQQFVLQIGY